MKTIDDFLTSALIGVLLLAGGVLFGLSIAPTPQPKPVHLICQPTKALAPEAQGLPPSQVTPANYPFIYECEQK